MRKLPIRVISRVLVGALLCPTIGVPGASAETVRYPSSRLFCEKNMFAKKIWGFPLNEGKARVILDEDLGVPTEGIRVVILSPEDEAGFARSYEEISNAELEDILSDREEIGAERLALDALSLGDENVARAGASDGQAPLVAIDAEAARTPKNYSDVKLPESALRNPEEIKRIRRYDRIKKRFDQFLVVASLPLTAPVALWVAYMVKRSSKGSILFRQQRIGQDGKSITVYKFRTMYVGSENGAAETAVGDARITPWGKKFRAWRLDELPQLYNVLLGNMALVGPRPTPVSVHAQMTKADASWQLRELVRPGMTSLPQIHLGYAEGIAANREKLEQELYYIKNMSFALDVSTILETILMLVRGKMDTR